MYNSFFKKCFDIIMVSFLLILLLPFLTFISIILLCTGENQIFYLQERVGLKNKIFKIFKFATMVKNSSNMGTGSLTLRNDPRILPFGKFLRISKINEFPQLLNVFLGNMSVVGPRPQMHVDFMKFPDAVQKKIYNVKPGITGIGSIIFRDEEKWISAYKGNKHEYYKNFIAPYKGELELWYQKNISFKTDVLLILSTIISIIRPSSNFVYKLFPSLPEKPNHLKI
tara:strand:- start:5562 stop:6239 length:678 start_codon:yes stop_codon:yes gene_type:complete